MKKEVLSFILFLTCTFTMHAQNAGVALDLGYNYNKRSMFKGGVSLSAYNTRPYDSTINSIFDVWSFGAGADLNVGKFNGDTKIYPSGVINISSGFLGTKIDVSKYYINPAIGINFINFAKLNVGYSIPFDKLNGVQMKGFTVGITFSLGTRGYYMDLSN